MSSVIAALATDARELADAVRRSPLDVAAALDAIAREAEIEAEREHATRRAVERASETIRRQRVAS